MTEIAQEDGKWETCWDDDKVMIRIRWSIADTEGRHLYVRHYPAAMAFLCERECKRFNELNRSPFEWFSYAPK